MPKPVEKVSTGSKPVDSLLEGGIEKRTITEVYGRPGTGKTSLSISAAAEQSSKQKKVAYIDTENSFSTERFTQIKDKKFLENVEVFNPTSFEQQRKCVHKLEQKYELVIVDSLVSLYRLSQNEDIDEANRNLSSILGGLSRNARESNASVLVTNQVYDNPENGTTEQVGGDIPKYWCKAIINLRRGKEQGHRKAKLTKHRSIQKKTKQLEITDRGLVPRV